MARPFARGSLSTLCFLPIVLALTLAGCGSPKSETGPPPQDLVMIVKHKHIIYCKYCRERKVKSWITAAQKTITVAQQTEYPNRTKADWQQVIRDDTGPFENVEYSGRCDSRLCRKASRIAEQHDGLWEPEMCYYIAQRKVCIGMTPDQARAAWGRPEDINRDVGPWGVHEQWVYGYCYLYFENGVMTSYQN